MRDLSANLNDQQREAVTVSLGPVLVLAGAGSGKTRVLTYRIAYLLSEKLFSPGEILALTFTNKAAGAMRERIEKLLNIPSLRGLRQDVGGRSNLNEIATLPSVARNDVTHLTMGTFHSVCARILRAEIEKLPPSAIPPDLRSQQGEKERGYSRNFVIYDADDSARLVKQIVMELGISERIRPQVFGYYISAAKNRLLEPRALALDKPFLEESLQEVYELYQKRLQEHNAVDFDDLLRLVCELFSRDQTVLKKYQERFKYVLVDEYQDTNHAQYVMLRLLVKKHRNLFVVGDDAQSIYGFRGANMQNILDFKKDYPKARVIMLEQNYRSTQNILDAATEVIKLNPMQYEKKLWTENRSGTKLHFYEAADEMDEGRFVLRQILAKSEARESEELSYESEETPILNRFFQNRPRQYFPQVRSTDLPGDLNERVILYRTHAQSRPFEEVLLSAGVPYQIVGGIKFYERKEIKDVLAFLRLLANPRDLVSLERVINLPARGIGAAGFKTLAKAFAKYDYNFGRLSLNLDDLALPPKAVAGAKDFFGMLATSAKLSKTKSATEQMNFLLTRSGYKDSLLDGSPEGATRWENIEELFNVAARYKNLPWAPGVQAFLEEVALMTDLDSMEEEGNKLTLMTLHSAKGLEFNQVFLVGLEEGLLPHSRSLLSPQELAEEIRLAYVGMTRARQQLFLSYARQRQTYGELKRSTPSRILKAIPKRLLHKISN